MYFSLAVSPSGVPCLDLEKGALFLSFYYSCRLIPHDKLLPALLSLLQEVGSYRPLSGATAENFGKRVGSSGSGLDGFDWTAVEIMETTPPQLKIHTRLSSTSLARPLAHVPYRFTTPIQICVPAVTIEKTLNLQLPDLNFKHASTKHVRIFMSPTQRKQQL